MKKTFLITMLSIVIFSASAQQKTTNLDRAKAGVRKYLSLTMKDYSSYKPVQWGKLYPVYKEYEGTARARQLLDSITVIKEPVQFTYDAALTRLDAGIDPKTDSIYLSYRKELDPILPKIDNLLALFDREKKAFKKRLMGYEISHSYRGKNSYGAYVLGATKFYLTSTFRVEDTEDLNDDDEDN